MPNKDSFTFSDKLRKSKSVPLSKRLPSIVGGQNKQKRTLVQRAQRDLPFILVAVLALLLLPFLSRTGSDDIASTGDFAWNSLADERSFVEGGGADIMPAGSMQDPLDLILRPRSDLESSSVTMGTDASKSAYGSGSRIGSDDEYGDGTGDGYSSRSRSYSSTGSSTTKRPDYNTRKSYDESYTTKTTKKPATTKYGQKTRAGVRKSFERKATDINRALRISQMPGSRGGSPISHNLPIGQGPNKGSGTAFREGVRPIALQPMEARGGVGRSMTGENLYAEAARSRNAMNAGGPAKQNLLAAQMRDVDGKLTPEGPGFGGPGPGASVRPGAGGNGPGNHNGYHVDKPWWWDMMQTRSQKMWDLLYYKPREIWYTNMYNYASQLMNCLFTGNKDGDVSTMFGKKAGDDDMICEGAAMMSLGDYVERFSSSKTTKTKEGGSETLSDGEGARERWYQDCERAHGTPTLKEGKRKSFLQTRFECVGLDWGWFKGIFKAKSYGADCSHVNNDPLEFTYSVTKNGKTKERLEKKAIVALVAKVNDDNAKGEKRHILEGTENYYYKLKGQEIVVWADMATSVKATKEQLGNIRDANICTLTKVIGFVPRADRGVVEKQIDKANYRRIFDKQDYDEFDDNYTKQNPVEVDKNGTITKRYTRSKEIETRQNKAIKDNDKDSWYSESDVNNLARFRSQIQAAQRICLGKATNSDVHPLTLNGVYDLADFVSEDGLFNSGVKKNSYKECTIWDKKPEFTKWINTEGCDGVTEQRIQIMENVTFKAKITDSKDKHVYAVLVDQIDQQSKARVAYVVDYELSDNKALRKCEEGSKDCTYQFNVDSATLGITATDVKDPDGGGTTFRGSGVIFWIVTQGNATFKAHQGDFVADNTHMVKIDDLIESSQSLISETCRYRWCNDLASCPVDKTPAADNYCVEGDEAYEAVQVSLGDKKVMVKTNQKPIEMSEEKLKELEECVMLCQGSDGVHICDKNGIPDDNQPPCPLSEMEPQITIPQCHGCCEYTTSDGETNNYKSVEINGKHYIVDATPSDCENKKNNKCTPAAWSKEGDDLIVYDIGMNPYDPKCLKFVPGGSKEPFETCTGNGCPPGPVKLTAFGPKDSDSFTLIHEQSYTMGPNLDPNPGTGMTKDPQFFELFPQLTLQKIEDIPEIDLSDCNVCDSVDYDNVWVTPRNNIDKTISAKIKNCLDQIETLKNSLPADKQHLIADKFDKLYFYGYASKRGSHDPHMIPGADRIGCTTSKHDDGSITGRKHTMWDPGYEELGDCNKALSEDRNLYIMAQAAIDSGRQENITIDKTSSEKYLAHTNDDTPFKGFSNTKAARGVNIIRSTQRLDRNYIKDLVSDTPKGFTFISRPCGSDGAIYDYNVDVNTGLADRYVVVTLIGNDDAEERCQDNNRMTCSIAEKELADIVRKLNSALGTNKIKFNPKN